MKILYAGIAALASFVAVNCTALKYGRNDFYDDDDYYGDDDFYDDYPDNRFNRRNKGIRPLGLLRKPNPIRPPVRKSFGKKFFKAGSGAQRQNNNVRKAPAIVPNPPQKKEEPTGIANEEKKPLKTRYLLG